MMKFLIQFASQKMIPAFMVLLVGSSLMAENPSHQISLNLGYDFSQSKLIDDIDQVSKTAKTIAENSQGGFAMALGYSYWLNDAFALGLHVGALSLFRYQYNFADPGGFTAEGSPQNVEIYGTAIPITANASFSFFNNFFATLGLGYGPIIISSLTTVEGQSSSEKASLVGVAGLGYKVALSNSLELNAQFQYMFIEPEELDPIHVFIPSVGISFLF